MSKRLNTVDDMKMDNLIYDHFKIIDAKVVPVTVSDGPGTLRRGQLLDFDAEKKTFAVHASGGTANCIVCNDTEYTEEDSSIPTSVYIPVTLESLKSYLRLSWMLPMTKIFVRQELF